MARSEATSRARPDRRLATVVLIALGSVVALLSFADGAPGLVRRTLRATAQVTTALQDRIGLQLVDLRDLPFAWDVVGHFVLWAAAAIVGRWALRDRVTALTLALGSFAASYAVEIGQSVLTVNRRPDLRDLVANALGIMVGMAVALGAERAATLVDRTRSPEPVG